MGDLGGVLRGARKARGKTQAEYAAKLERDQPTLSNWEKNRRLPEPHELRAVSRVYGVPMAVLFPLYLTTAERLAAGEQLWEEAA